MGKRMTDLERHTVLCPHCHHSVLDHMTECPHCGGELKSAYYQANSTSKKVRNVVFAVFLIIGVFLFLWFMFRR